MSPDYSQVPSTACKALGRLADAHPDPESGDNTAISTALDMKLTQVYIVHPQNEAAEAELTTH